ncbi:MAG: UbiX family flavin prenyltransferase [Candidatus Altarchaeaceae archaeon]
MRLIVGITGASGAILAKKFLEVLKDLNIDVDLIVTEGGERVINDENLDLDSLKKLAKKFHKDFSSELSSGSSLYGKEKRDALVIIPCSMNFVAKFANGISDNLLLRVCDVMLKENKKIIIVPREIPLNETHLENLLKLKRKGIIIIPPMLTFYHNPKTIDDLINFIIGKILDNLGIENNLFERWKN